jgi:hypothetical protein
LVGGGEPWHVTANDAEPDPPAGTDAVCEVLPAWQLLASPDSVTVWLPEDRLLKVTLPLSPMDWDPPPSTLTVYPSGSRSEPLVLVETVREPVVGGGAWQVTANDAELEPPAGTSALCELPPLTEQFDATPLSATVWLPAERLEKVTLPLSPIDRELPPSTLTV